MKIKPARARGGVVVELSRKEERVPDRELLKIGTILVPIDFSDCSKKALQYAVAFADQFQANLVLVHVVPVNYFIGTEIGAIDFPLMCADLKKGAETHLAALAKNEVVSKAAVKTLVREGQPVQEIVAAAKSSGADLIILSTHGRTGLNHVFMGSVAENVVRHAPCPVLIVRENEREFVRG
jgi:nucleotide-binding universal stress UspA family protein